MNYNAAQEREKLLAKWSKWAIEEGIKEEDLRLPLTLLTENIALLFKAKAERDPNIKSKRFSYTFTVLMVPEEAEDVDQLIAQQPTEQEKTSLREIHSLHNEDPLFYMERFKAVVEKQPLSQRSDFLEKYIDIVEAIVSTHLSDVRCILGREELKKSDKEYKIKRKEWREYTEKYYKQAEEEAEKKRKLEPSFFEAYSENNSASIVSQPASLSPVCSSEAYQNKQQKTSIGSKEEVAVSNKQNLFTP